MRYADDDLAFARRLKALGHPARLAVIEALAAEGGCCCGEIVRRLPLAQSTVSQHLKLLKDAGLIEGSLEGPRAAYALDEAEVGRLVAALRGLADRLERGAGCCALDPAATGSAADGDRPPA